MTRRSAFAVVAALAALGLAGAVFSWLKPRPQARPSDIELFPQSSLVLTNRGPYVCPIRVLVEGMPPLSPPDVDPACHHQSKAEAHAEAERKRLLASPEFLALRSLTGRACDEKFLTYDQVHQFLVTRPGVQRWLDRYPHAAMDLGLPLHPGIAMGCPTP